MKEYCYWCGREATSKEHVPPKCLFPERKDMRQFYEKDFRCNLITVPSCDEHNMKKSNNDEYLMTCLGGRVGNNGVAYLHNATKVKRALERNPKIVEVEKLDMVKLGEKKFPVNIITVDNYRLVHSFESIARALYFHEEKKIFNGECRIISELFLHPDYEKESKFILESIQLIEEEREQWKTKTKGDNKDIFTYQFSPLDGFKCQTLAMTFYKGTKVYAVFSNMSEQKREELKLALKFLGNVFLSDSDY